MRQARNPKIGQIVSIPTHQFAPHRTGWNGWNFSKGIVIATGKTADGTKCYKVQYPSRGYDHTNKQTATQWYRKTAVFETSLWSNEQELKYSREELEDGCYTSDTEFLIDKGVIKQNG